MSDLVWIVYVIDTVLDSVEGVRAFLSGVLFFGSFCVVIAFAATNIHGMQAAKEEWNPRFIKMFKLGFMPAALLLFFLSLIPSSSTAYKMLAVYGATELAQLEEVQEISGKSLEVINKVMDDYLAESEQ